MTRALLAVNAGSATLKFSVYGLPGQALLLRGLVDRIASPDATLTLRAANGEIRQQQPVGADRAAAIAAMLQALQDQGISVAAVAHRVVHGGGVYTDAVVIKPEVRTTLAGFVPLAPLHQPASLAVIDAFAHSQPGIEQIACFDTGFHAGQSTLATRFGIARHWHDEGVRAYGFHGLSYAAIARQLPALGLADARVVVCHLGSGASACAIHAGRSVASSMGLSALEGLMMGTRPGHLDPEVLLYWQERHGMDVAAIRDELYKRSGLLGVSGISADMRELLASERPEAAEAVALFCYRVAREVASLAAAMGGFDALVFTAGIGERSAPVRERIVRQLGWLGLALDADANHAHAARLTRADSVRHAWMLATDEEGEMARQAQRLL